jgi:hypothetical protein
MKTQRSPQIDLEKLIGGRSSPPPDGRISATRRNGSRDGSGWRIECSQLSLKRKSPPQIETAQLRGERFFEKNVDPRRKTFSEYPLCNLLKDLNS